MHDKLIVKVNAIDIKIASDSELVTQAQYDADKQVLEKKIDDFD